MHGIQNNYSSNQHNNNECVHEKKNHGEIKITQKFVII